MLHNAWIWYTGNYRQ